MSVFSIAVLALSMAQTLPTPIVIAHRGASADRPEHTLEAYRVGVRQGADYIEPDLVMTKDGVLIARHENDLSDSTDVASKPEFASRRTTKTIDGQSVTGWFSEDFTLEEIKTLRAIERLPKIRTRNVRYDGQFDIPTFDEVLELVQAESKRTGRSIGVYPEIKHPTYFAGLGLPMEKPLVDALHRRGYRGQTAAVYVQCFEIEPLKKLRTMTQVPLIQLIDSTGKPYDVVAAGSGPSYLEMISDAGLKAIAEYAQGIGPNKQLVIPSSSSGLGEPTDLVARAKAHGLKVHIWTLRSEDVFLPANLKGKPQDEALAYFRAGVDGAFADSPGDVRRARDRFRRER